MTFLASPRTPLFFAVRAAGVVALALAAAACGGAHAAGPPIRLKAWEPVGSEMKEWPGRPMIIEFREGDELPLAFSIDGDFLVTPADLPPIRLRAKRAFFLKVDEKGFHTSLDGEDFEEKPHTPGSFRIGVGAHKEGLTAEMRIVTPKGLSSK
jgi:hypothetical protein